MTYRLTGTKNLEESINDIAMKSASKGLEVSLDPVMVPHWVRNYESAHLLSPRKKELNILGLGYSPSTPGSNGITAEVIVVDNFEELEERCAEVFWFFFLSA